LLRWFGETGRVHLTLLLLLNGQIDFHQIGFEQAFGLGVLRQKVLHAVAVGPFQAFLAADHRVVPALPSERVAGLLFPLLKHHWVLDDLRRYLRRLA